MKNIQNLFSITIHSAFTLPQQVHFLVVIPILTPLFYLCTTLVQLTNHLIALVLTFGSQFAVVLFAYLQLTSYGMHYHC